MTWSGTVLIPIQIEEEKKFYRLAIPNDKLDYVYNKLSHGKIFPERIVVYMEIRLDHALDLSKISEHARLLAAIFFFSFCFNLF